MNWMDELENFEKNKNWKDAVEFMQLKIKEDPSDPEKCIRNIYLLHNIIVEEDRTKKEHDYFAKLLLDDFNDSLKRFGNNSEYLFFIGTIIQISEWYFGLNDDNLAKSMLKKALDSNPTNLLYEWEYSVSQPKDDRTFSLANEIITNHPEIVDWLKSKGFPGNYVLRGLKYFSKEYLKGRTHF